MRRALAALAACLLASTAYADQPAASATIESAANEGDQLLVDVTVSNPGSTAIVALIDPPMLLPTAELACLGGPEWRGSLVRLDAGTSFSIAIVVPGAAASDTVGFSFLWAPVDSLPRPLVEVAPLAGHGLLLTGRSGTVRDGLPNPRAAKLFPARATAARVPVAVR